MSRSRGGASGLPCDPVPQTSILILIVVGVGIFGACHKPPPAGLEPPFPRCAFSNGTDPKELNTYLSQFLARSGQELKTWSAFIENETARLELMTGQGTVTITVTIEGDCLGTPRVAVLGDGKEGPDWESMAAGLPIPRMTLHPSEPSEGSPRWPWLIRILGTGPAVDIVFAVGAMLVLVFWAAAAAGTRAWMRPGLLDAAVAMGLALTAAWPVFGIAFTNDAQVLRAGFARADLFGDWNHPFLSYLLNRPAALLSLEPWALRVIPFLFVATEVFLVMIAVSARAGRLGGYLAAVFFACEVRRRHGMTDLGDWDLAGAVLAGILLWLQTREESAAPPRWRSTILAAFLVMAGVLSSWLMIVPAAILVTILWLDVWRGRLPKVHAAVVGLAFLPVAFAAGRVFLLGAASLEPSWGTFTEFLDDMGNETPIGRTPWMALPLALGLVWLGAGLRCASHRFAVLSMIAVPAAVVFSWASSHVNGGYYIGLVTPLVAWAAGAGTGQAVGWLGDWFARRAGTRIATAIRVVTVLVVVLATLSLPDEPLFGWTRGVERIAEFDAVVESTPGPILTNWSDLGRVIGHERARTGRGDDLGMLADGGPPDLARRIRVLDPTTCLPAQGGPGANDPFHLVLVQPDRIGAEHCRKTWAAGCDETLSKGLRDPFVRFFLCRGPDSVSVSGQPLKAPP